jgi:hypothetical protein
VVTVIEASLLENCGAYKVLGLRDCNCKAALKSLKKTELENSCPDVIFFTYLCRVLNFMRKESVTRRMLQSDCPKLARRVDRNTRRT